MKHANAPKSPGIAERSSRGAKAWSGCVLVVDDDADYRRIVGLRMESVGCECHLCGTHAQAVRLLLRQPEIEVAVVDYHMKGENVALLVRRIRALRPDVTLVGHSSMERRAQFAVLGVDRFLLKPWTPDELLALLRDDPA